MKRTPLERKTPLRARATLRQTAPIARKAAMGAGVPMKRKRPKRSNAERDEEYLAFVRRQPCMVPGCPHPSEAHHFETEGMGLKCSDYKTVPLCHLHHVEGWHRHGTLPGATRAEWLARFVEMADALQQQYRAGF